MENMIRPDGMGMKHIPVGLMQASDEEDIDVDTFTTSELLDGNEQDEVSTNLLNTGTMSSIAAAAALATSRKRQQRPHRFEVNPAQRKRQHTRLIKKLKQVLHELSTRCGQQAVVLCVSPGKRSPSYHVFGSSPLDRVVRSCQDVIFRGLEKELQGRVGANCTSNGLFDLPQLTVDGMPTSIDEMNQAQLRMFIPEMLKYSLGRGKPGWGQESKKPVWWPQDVPWANVRRDDRTKEAKICVTWTQALRQIVRNCYSFHGREDLLRSIIPANKEPKYSLRDKFPAQNTTVINHPTLVQALQNSDGSVSLVQVDSGQTIATISRDQTGSTVATLNTTSDENAVDIAVGEMTDTGWLLANHDRAIDDTYAGITGVAGDSTDLSKQTGLTIGSDMIIASNFSDPTGAQAPTDASAMIHIPMSVYEKIARSIHHTGSAPTVSVLPDGRLQFQTDVTSEQLQAEVTSEHLQALQRKKTPIKESYTETSHCDVQTEHLPT